MNFPTEKWIKNAFWWIFALALFFFCFAIGNREPLGYEFRHGVIARLMLKDGFSFIPTLFDVPYAQKPPFFFWVLYPFVALTGKVSVGVLVMPSALSAVGSTLLLFGFLRRANLRWAVYSCLILMTLSPFYGKARESTIDILLAFCVAAALVGFFFFYHEKKKGALLGMLAGLVAGWLTKGPLGVCLPTGVILVYLGFRREWKNCVWYGVGLGVLFALLFVVWYGLCYVFLGKEFVEFALRSHTYSRFLNEPDKPFYFYLELLAFQCLPWVYPLFWSLWIGIRKKAARLIAPEMWDRWCFSWIWFAVTFLLFSAASAKHVRYFVLAFPPMAVLAGSFFVALKREAPVVDFFWKWVARLLPAAVVLLVPVCLAVFFIPGHDLVPGLWCRTAIVFAAVALFGILEWVRARRKKVFGWPSLTAGLLALLFFNAQFVEGGVSYYKSPKEMILRFEERAHNQNPLCFYRLMRDDTLRYLYYSPRIVHASLIEKAEKIPATMQELKYQRGLIVTYRKHFNQWPEEIQKNCTLVYSEKFRSKEWVLVEWKGPL